MLELVPLPSTILPARAYVRAPRPRTKLLPLPKSSRAAEGLHRAAAGVTAPRGLVGLALATVIASVCGVVGLPAAIPWVLALGSVHFLGTVARHALSPSYVRKVHGEFGLPLHPIVAPEQIEPDDLRASYLAILRTHEDLRATLEQHEPVSVELSSLYRSCSDAVNLAGRTALLAGPVRRFLDGRARAAIAEDIVRLDALAESAGDGEARAIFDHASATRRREAQVHADVDAIYARMAARLEVVSATLATAIAVSIHLCTVGVDQSDNTRDALVEQIGALDDDLRFLEDTLTIDVPT